MRKNKSAKPGSSNLSAGAGLKDLNKAIVGTIIVAALGYFVDIYDLLIFSILRVPSLKALHVPDDHLLSTGLVLLNLQMGGMLVGGIIWGVLGDKRGRLSVLLGSIFLYSVANLANGFATSVEVYGVCRLFAGLGLAGELGAGITLVSELMTKETRGYGTTLVASIGIAGAVLAAFVAEHLPWQKAYFIGGGLGLALLTMRVALHESSLFHSLKSRGDIKRGDLMLLVREPKRLLRYLRCIFVGMPIWFVIGILVTFSPEFAKVFKIAEPVSAGRAVGYCYFATVFGDLFCGIFSQLFKNRKKVLIVSIAITAGAVAYFLSLTHLAPEARVPQAVYNACLFLGIGAGYWSVFVANAAEQFGINLRATVTTTVPNFVRGAIVPITWIFNALRVRSDMITSAWFVGALCLAMALISVSGLEESFGRDLDYFE